jgi:hypothetical protein
VDGRFHNHYHRPLENEMTRINSLASFVLMLTGLNVALGVALGHNYAAEILSNGVYDIATLIVGLAGVVALADHFGWTRD